MKYFIFVVLILTSSICYAGQFSAMIAESIKEAEIEKEAKAIEQEIIYEPQVKYYVKRRGIFGNYYYRESCSQCRQ